MVDQSAEEPSVLFDASVEWSASPLAGDERRCFQFRDRFMQAVNERRPLVLPEVDALRLEHRCFDPSEPFAAHPDAIGSLALELKAMPLKGFSGDRAGLLTRAWQVADLNPQRTGLTEGLAHRPDGPKAADSEATHLSRLTLKGGVGFVYFIQAAPSESAATHLIQGIRYHDEGRPESVEDCRAALLWAIPEGECRAHYVGWETEAGTFPESSDPALRYDQRRVSLGELRGMIERVSDDDLAEAVADRDDNEGQLLSIPLRDEHGRLAFRLMVGDMTIGVVSLRDSPGETIASYWIEP